MPRHVAWASPTRQSLTGGVEMGSVASYGTVDGSHGLAAFPSSSPVEGAPPSRPLEAPLGAHERTTNVVARSAAVVFNAAGRAKRFVLRRHNVRRQTLKDVIHSMKRPRSLGPMSEGVPNTYASADGDTRSEFVDLESLRPAAPPTLHPAPKMGTLSLLSAVISIVLCSRFGCESVVGAGGPYYALIGLACIPWVWYLPTGLVVAELATAVPSNAGVLMWTNVAFPPFVSFFCVFVTLLLSVAGLAVGAALCANYLAYAVRLPEAVLLLFRAVFIALSALLNAWTVDGLSAGLKLITVLTTIPFLILVLWQLIGDGGFNATAMAAQPDHVNIPVFLSYLAFTHSGLENLGSLVEDTKQPEKTLFRAVTPAMFASFFVYFLPVAAGVSAVHQAGGDFSSWKPGYWGHVAGVVATPSFQHFMEWCGIFARFGALLGMTATSARLLAGMGSMNAFPTVASNYLAMYHDTRFTPINAIVIASTVALPFAVLLSTNDLVAVFQVLSSIRSLIAVYAAFFVLRWKHGDLPRPYRLPLGFVGSALLLAPSIIFVVAVGVSAALLGVVTLGISIGAITLSLVMSLVWVKWLRPDGLAGAIEEFAMNEVPATAFVEDDADLPAPEYGAA